MNDVAFYIHFPFCNSKCVYCDFYSIVQLEAKPRYLNALRKEIKLYQQSSPFAGARLSTLYLGGGTPSLLTAEELKQLLHWVSNGFSFAPDIEITCEANPGTLTSHRLTDYQQAGVNRLSIGVQSFDDKELCTLTRIHSAREAEAAITKARAAGFANLGVDLIFGIPLQNLESWQFTLEKAVALSPQHISMYGLTIEQGTPLAQAKADGKVVKCDEELEREMYLLGKQVLESASYEHYEISNFALPGCRSRHNQKYWDGSPFLSFGPSAHSYDGNKRWWNKADVTAYCEQLEAGALPVEGSEILSNQQSKLELIMLGLRRREGIDLAAWHELAGRSFLSDMAEVIEEVGGIDENAKPFSESRTGKLMTLQDGRVCLTRDGLLLYDAISSRFAARVGDGS